MSICNDLEISIQKFIRPATFPVAIKFLEDESLFSSKTRRPLRDIGNRLNLCQGIAIARRYGWTIGFTKEDHACANSLIILGLEDAPHFIQNGSIVYPPYTDSLEHGAITQKMTPRSDKALDAILISPLHRADFEPDLVLFYCNPGQAVRLVQASLYFTGGTIDSKFMGRCACGSELVTPLQTGECQVVVPGGGEKVFAMLGDDEMVFAAPGSKLQQIIDGLSATHKEGAARIPAPYFGLKAEPVFPPVYAELERHFGLKD